MLPTTTTRAPGEASRNASASLPISATKHIMVLRNHGLFIVGRSIAEAFIATYRMERACAMQLAFQQSGAPFYQLTQAVVSAGYARSNAGAARGHDPNKFDWPALLRKLDRIDPSYKE